MRQKRTPDFMAEEIIKKMVMWKKTVTEYIDFQLSEAELKAVKKQRRSQKMLKNRSGIKKDFFDERSNTGWTTGGHTGEDVNVYAYGPQAEAFFQDKLIIQTKRRLFFWLSRWHRAKS